MKLTKITLMDSILLSLVPPEDKYELVADYNIKVTIKGTVYDIWCPEGFVYDGASIPAYFWQIIYTPFTPKVMRAALIHDWLYYTHKVQKQPIDRGIADDIFRNLLLGDGVGSFKANAMYSAVRLAGGSAWANTLENIITLQELEIKKAEDAWKFGLIPPYTI